MAINEAYNVDCIEYMRSLPDGYFDIAVCDPPYGSGNDTKLGGGQKVRRNIRPVLQTGTDSREEDGRSITPISHKRTEADRFGERFRRYFKPDRKQTVGGGITGSYMGCCPSSAIFR